MQQETLSADLRTAHLDRVGSLLRPQWLRETHERHEAGAVSDEQLPPTCVASVSPTVLWPANAKPVAITGTATVADNLSGIASVIGGTITSNEILSSGDVKGLTVNALYAIVGHVTVHEQAVAFVLPAWSRRKVTEPTEDNP